MSEVALQHWQAAGNNGRPRLISAHLGAGCSLAATVTAEELRQLVAQVADESQLRRVDKERSCDFSFEIPDVARFRRTH